MQTQKRIPEKKKHCYGAVIETRRGKKVTLKLTCHGKCTDGKCKKQSRKDHHGTTITWCGCNDQPEGCNIFIEKKHNGEERFDCFTLGCGEGSECLPVEQGSHEEDGEKTTIWVCACVRTKKPPVAAA